MPRTARLRKAQNETVKSKINTGFNEALNDSYEDGYYLINGNKLTCEKLKKQVAWDKHVAGDRLKKIPEDLAEKMEIVARVDEKKLKEFVSELHVGVQAKAEKSVKSTVGNAEMEAAAKAYAQLGGSALTGFYADVGATAEAKVAINGKIFQLEAKVYAEVKAGIKYGMLGVSAAAEAEVGIEDKLNAKVKEFELKSGTKISVNVYACLKAFAKASAFAGVGSMTGAEAGACIGVEGKIGAEIKRQRKGEEEVTAGDASVALTVKAGFSVGAKAGFDLKEVVEDGNPFTIFTQGASITFIAGCEYEIAIKVLSDMYVEAKDKVKLLLDKSVREEILVWLKKEFDRIMEELEFQIKDSARKVKRGWDNTQNYGKKLLIAIESGLGHQSTAMQEEIKRQVHKLHKYKRELDAVIAKVTEEGLDVDAVKQEVSDPGFEKRVNKWYGPTISHKLIKKELMLDQQRYDRRILKLNKFLEDSYAKTIQKVQDLIQGLYDMVDGFNSKGIPDNFNNSADFQKMVQKIQEIQGMIGAIDSIIASKKELMNEVAGDQNLRAMLNNMTTQYQQVKKDFDSFYQALKHYVKGLPV
jgi:hypothetical protein